MNRKRDVPTDLFQDERFRRLNGEAQSVFFGLILNANPQGRGPASVPILARKLAKTPDLIQVALQHLSASSFIQYFQVEGQNLYYISAWEAWKRHKPPSHSQASQLAHISNQRRQRQWQAVE